MRKICKLYVLTVIWRAAHYSLLERASDLGCSHCLLRRQLGVLSPLFSFILCAGSLCSLRGFSSWKHAFGCPKAQISSHFLPAFWEDGEKLPAGPSTFSFLHP